MNNLSTIYLDGNKYQVEQAVETVFMDNYEARLYPGPQGYKINGTPVTKELFFEEINNSKELKAAVKDQIPTTFTYRKKPVEIQAVHVWQIIKSQKDMVDRDLYPIPAWAQSALDDGDLKIFNMNSIVVETLEGMMTGHWYDLIIRGVQRKLYPCKPEIFKETYEKVE